MKKKKLIHVNPADFNEVSEFDVDIPVLGDKVPHERSLSEKEDKFEKIIKDIARKAREKAVHYNDFKVGAAVLACVRDKENDLSLVFVAGANNRPLDPKLHREPVPKICAEANAFARLFATYHDVERIYRLGLYAPNQPDKHTGRKNNALPPCGVCRTRLSILASETSKLILPEEFTIISTEAESEKIVSGVKKDTTMKWTYSDLITEYGIPDRNQGKLIDWAAYYNLHTNS